jgi:DNA polymerase-3 subunit beta
MELTVRKSDLLPELQLFQGIIERKNTIPILGNVLIETSGDGLVRLLATDLEVGLRSTCAASVVKGGSLTIPAKKLYEIVRALPETKIQIKEGAKGSVRVSADRFDSRMQTLPREDFPTLPETTDESSLVSLPRAGLREMVAKTQFAITGEDTRYFLNGALLVLQPGKMQLVATDGHRLALVATTREKEKSEEDEVQAILPKKTLWELARLLTDGDEDVQYLAGENHLFFNVDGRQLISRVIDAQFPAYERVVPKSNDKTIEFERDRLTSAIKRVALLSSERSKAVKLQISKDHVDITSNSPEVGEATETLAIEYGGKDVEICFNAQYVLDFLSVADSSGVQLHLKDEMSQAVMTPVESDSCDYTYVIMPMRV